jgi:hypothetical protein
LSELETVLQSMELPELQSRLKRHRIEAGELLWQGKFGFCVAKTACGQDKAKREVHILRQRTSTKFGGSFLMPVGGILNSGTMDSLPLSHKARETLCEMVEELKAGLARVSSDKR